MFDDHRVDLQLSRYIYDERIFGKGGDYYELYLFAHYRDLITFEFAYAPDAYDIGEDTFNYQLTARYPFLAALDASFGVGFFEASDSFEYDYWYWNAGVTWYFHHLAVDARYIGAKEVNEVFVEQHRWTGELPYQTAPICFDCIDRLLATPSGGAAEEFRPGTAAWPPRTSWQGEKSRGRLNHFADIADIPPTKGFRQPSLLAREWRRWSPR